MEGLQNQIIGLAGLVALAASNAVEHGLVAKKSLRDMRRNSPLLKSRFHLRKDAAKQGWKGFYRVGCKQVNCAGVILQSPHSSLKGAEGVYAS